MVHHSLKDNCVPLVGLCYCSYYSACRIARQFGDCQGAPNDDGSFHTLEFTDRTLSKIREAWPRRRVTRDIRPSIPSSNFGVPKMAKRLHEMGPHR